MKLPKNWGISFKLENSKIHPLWYSENLTIYLPQFSKILSRLPQIELKDFEQEIVTIYLDNSVDQIELMFIHVTENHYFLTGKSSASNTVLDESDFPRELDEHLLGNLVAQATINYSTLWSKGSSDTKRKIDQIFQDALRLIEQDPDKIGNGSISLAELTCIDLLSIHSYSRKKLQNNIEVKERKAWLYCVGLKGEPSHIHFPNKNKFSQLKSILDLSQMCSELIEKDVSAIIMGQEKLMTINFLFGQINAIVTNNLNLLLMNAVIKAITELSNEVQADLASALANYYYGIALNIIDQEIRTIPYIKVANIIENGSTSLINLLLQKHKTKEVEEKKGLLENILEEAINEITEYLKQRPASASKTQLKLLLLGDGAVGKTTSKHVFMGSPYRMEYQATLGVDFTALEIKIEDHGFQAQIWDLGGQERFRFVRKQFYRGASGAIAVFDLTRRETLANVETWVNDYYTQVGKPTPLVIFGNKKDLRNEGLDAVTDEEAVEFVNKLKEKIDSKNRPMISYIPGSAKTGENLKLAYHLITCRAAGNFFKDYVSKMLDVMKEEK